MSNLTGTKEFTNQLRKLLTTDPKHPDTWNPNYQALINNDVYLKQFADEVKTARGGSTSLNERVQGIEQAQEALSPDFIDNLTGTLKFALTQVSVNSWGVRALREQIQQEGEIVLQNRGVIRGCTVTRSTTAARNLNLSDGACFAKGRAFSVTPGNNAASVPSNLAGGSVVVYAYLYQNSSDVWKLAVTAIGQAVPDDAITIYKVTIPANSTDATDPTLNNVTITDVRRIEQQFPQLFNSAPQESIAINTLRASDYRLDFDVVAAEGAPCDPDHIEVASRATNGFSIRLASAADSVRVRWRASKLNN